MSKKLESPVQLATMVLFHADKKKKNQVAFDGKLAMIIFDDSAQRKVTLSFHKSTGGAPKSKTFYGIKYDQCELEYWLA